MAMYHDQTTVGNDTDEVRRLIVEPWAHEIALPARTTYRVVARADVPGELEVIRDGDCVVVFAWPTATLDVYHGDRLLLVKDLPVPGIPPGMSMREFVVSMFMPGGEPPTRTGRWSRWRASLGQWWRRRGR